MAFSSSPFGDIQASSISIPIALAGVLETSSEPTTRKTVGRLEPSHIVIAVVARICFSAAVTASRCLLLMAPVSHAK